MSDDSYLAHYEEARDAVQQRIWTFYEAILNLPSKRRLHERLINGWDYP